MPKLQLALEQGGPKRLELTWELRWKNFRIALDGREIGRVDGGKADLDHGQEFPLPDGTRLHVQLVRTAMNVELRVERDGVPVPGSSSDPHQRIKQCAYLLYFLAALNTALGVISMASGSGLLESVGVGFGSILIAVLLAVLGFFTYRRSRVALILAIILYALDGISTLAMAASASGHPNIGGIFVRVLFLGWMVRGVQAMNALRRQEQQSGLAPQP